MTVCYMTPSTIIKFWKTLLNKRLIKKRMYYVTNKITEGASVENIRMLQHTYGLTSLAFFGRCKLSSVANQNPLSILQVSTIYLLIIFRGNFFC